jgi:hypothetical protein
MPRAAADAGVVDTATANAHFFVIGVVVSVVSDLTVRTVIHDIVLQLWVV